MTLQLRNVIHWKVFKDLSYLKITVEAGKGKKKKRRKGKRSHQTLNCTSWKQSKATSQVDFSIVLDLLTGDSAFNVMISSSWSSSLQAYAILTAVSCLSPVRTQICNPALRKLAMVSGTPSCKRSSIPVAPNHMEKVNHSTFSKHLRFTSNSKLGFLQKLQPLSLGNS